MQSTQPPEVTGKLREQAGGSEIARLLQEIAILDAKVETMARQLRELEPLAAIAADAFDHHVARLAAAGVDVDARARVALQLAEQLTRPEVAKLVEILTQPRLLSTASTLAQAVAAVELPRATPVGLWGLWRATREPETQRGLGVVTLLLRALGLAVAPADNERRALGGSHADKGTDQ